MILALVLAAAPVATTAPAPEVEQEIVVLGEKLKYWRGNWKSRKGKFSCKTTKSTGDKAIDKIGCDALQHCAAPRVGEIEAIYAAKHDKATREKLLAPINKAVGECLVETRNDGIAELAGMRAAARSGS